MDGYSPERIAILRRMLDRCFGPVLDPQPSDDEVVECAREMYQVLRRMRTGHPSTEQEKK